MIGIMLGPTHEEVIRICRHEIKTYRSFQKLTRSNIRMRFVPVSSDAPSEFGMKDAYSFDAMRRSRNQLSKCLNLKRIFAAAVFASSSRSGFGTIGELFHDSFMADSARRLVFAHMLYAANLEKQRSLRKDEISNDKCCC